MIGSGLEEIVIESGICMSGSIDQVLNGKHHNRAVLIAIALDKLLLEEFVRSSNYDISVLTELQSLAACPSSDNLSCAEDSDAWHSS